MTGTVPFSERRHRLNSEEIPEVMKALALLLRRYVREERDLDSATVAFMPFFRMLYCRSGRPNYPEPVTWNTIVELLEWYHSYVRPALEEASPSQRVEEEVVAE